MSTISARATVLSRDSTLDARVCAEIGAELARVRAERGLTVAQVGEKLLLSPRQVRALEAVEFEAFHNATFHLNALKKYAAFAELPPARVAVLAVATAKPGNALPATRPDDEGIDADGASRRGLVLVLSTLAVVAAVGVGGYALWARQTPAPGAPLSAPSVGVSSPPVQPLPAPTPPEPPAPAAEVPAAVPSAPADAGASSVVPASFGMLRVPHATWIFVRDADNVVIERSLREGESVELESQPTYLAVGRPDAELRIGDRSIDLSSFVANGQIRIRAGDFDALVQGASPIQAPTSVGR